MASVEDRTNERTRAEHLLAESREVHWAFPTSLGRPVKSDVPAWATRLVSERDAVSAAAAWFVRHGDRAAAYELAARLWRIWVLARDEAGGRAFLASVLDAPSTAPGDKGTAVHGETASSRFRALALYGDGLFAFRQGDLSASRARNEAALLAAKATRDREAEGFALLGMSRVELSENRARESHTHALAARTLLRELGETYEQAPLHMVAQATRLIGTLDEAAALFAASLGLNRKIEDRSMVLVELHNLGHIEIHRGKADDAERCFDEIETLGGPAADPYDRALRSFNRAAVAFARGDRARAKTLLEEARAILAHDKVTLASDDARELEDLEKKIRR